MHATWLAQWNDWMWYTNNWGSVIYFSVSLQYVWSFEVWSVTLVVANEKNKTVEVAQISSWLFVLGTVIENHGYHIWLYVVAFTMLVYFMQKILVRLLVSLLEGCLEVLDLYCLLLWYSVSPFVSVFIEKKKKWWRYIAVIDINFGELSDISGIVVCVHIRPLK